MSETENQPAEPQPQPVPMPPEPEAQIQELSPQEEDLDGEVDVDEGAVTEDSENADEIPRPSGGVDYNDDADGDGVPDFDAEERDEDDA